MSSRVRKNANWIISKPLNGLTFMSQNLLILYFCCNWFIWRDMTVFFFCPNSFRVGCEFHDLPKMQSFSRRKENEEASKRFPSAALALWFNTKFWRGQLVGSPEFESQPRPFRHFSAQLAVSLNANVWNSLAGSGPSFLSFCSPNGSLFPRIFAAEHRTCAWQFNLEMMYHLHSENYCQRGSCSWLLNIDPPDNR